MAPQKAGSAAFSFGYLTSDAVKRADGVREVRKLDVFEISVVMAPMNNGTRVLSTKATGDDLPSHTELERRLIEEGIIAPVISSTAQPHAGDLDVAAAERDLMLSVLNARRNDDEERKAARPWIADPDDYI